MVVIMHICAPVRHIGRGSQTAACVIVTNFTEIKAVSTNSKISYLLISPRRLQRTESKSEMFPICIGKASLSPSCYTSRTVSKKSIATIGIEEELNSRR